MRTTTLVLWVAFCAACTREPEPQAPPKEDPVLEPSIADRALALTRELVLVDGHVDLPWRLSQAVDAGETPEDPSTRTAGGDFDYVRAKAGGLDAPFMSIYVPARFQTTGGAKAKADALIDLVEKLVADHPEKFVLARTPDDVIAAKQAGKIAFPMGIENGAALEDDLANVAHFHGRGVRYVTLTHSEDNLISDSSYADTRTHGGLSAFGEKVVAEMNARGMMIDISHLSDAAANRVLELSRAPVIASHSSARHFTPGWERNLSDALIEKLAENDGVIMINFGSSFLSKEVNEADAARRSAREAFMKAEGIDDPGDPKVVAWADEHAREHPKKFANLSKVADHFDHVRSLVGVEHIGLGSDFDGVGDSLPEGLKDVSQYPNLFAELLRRGYSEEDLAKIASGNVFRVWREVERIANGG